MHVNCVLFHCINFQHNMTSRDVIWPRISCFPLKCIEIIYLNLVIISYVKFPSSFGFRAWFQTAQVSWTHFNGNLFYLLFGFTLFSWVWDQGLSLRHFWSWCWLTSWRLNYNYLPPSIKATFVYYNMNCCKI